MKVAEGTTTAKVRLDTVDKYKCRLAQRRANSNAGQEDITLCQELDTLAVSLVRECEKNPGLGKAYLKERKRTDKQRARR